MDLPDQAASSGTTGPALAPVREVFSENFRPGAACPEIGAALAAYADGPCVADGRLDPEPQARRRAAGSARHGGGQRDRRMRHRGWQVGDPA